MTDQGVSRLDEGTLSLLRYPVDCVKGSATQSPAPTILPSYLCRNTELTHDEQVMRAQAIWNLARPLTRTLGEKYLRSRKIDFNPPELKFLWRSGVGSGAQKAYRPAIIAAIRDHTGLTAIARTVLRSDGLAKSKLDQTSDMIGVPRGSIGRWGPMPFDTLRLAENSEEAASAMIVGSLGTPVWPVFGASRYAAIDIPDTIRRVIIYTHQSETADDAIARAVPHLTSGNRALEIEYAPDGLGWNDYLQQLRR